MIDPTDIDWGTSRMLGLWVDGEYIDFTDAPPGSPMITVTWNASGFITVDMPTTRDL